MSVVDYAPTELIHAAQKGDQAAADILFSRNGGLIRTVVRRFAVRAAAIGADEDDLSQLASIGLWKAIRQFDSARGFRFSTFAVPMMVGEIRRFLRDDGPIKISRAAKETAARVAAAQSTLQQQLGREPTLSELAAQTGLTAEELASQELFLPQMISRDGENNPVAALADPSSTEETLIERLAVDSALGHLPPRTRKILVLRYIQGLSQQKIAPLFGVSQVQISRIERNGLQALRKQLALPQGL